MIASFDCLDTTEWWALRFLCLLFFLAGVVSHKLCSLKEPNNG